MPQPASAAQTAAAPYQVIVFGTASPANSTPTTAVASAKRSRSGTVPRASGQVFVTATRLPPVRADGPHGAVGAGRYARPMFLGITNTPRDYAWGSVSAIPELLGRTVTGAPQAELWLGAHAGSPSVVVNPAMVGGADTLRDWIDAEPEAALGPDRTGLPFLLKLLAAAAPLSLQAHPTPEQAREGFAREEAAGIPLDDPARNYKDPFPKPELVVALSDRFEALSGFRPVADTVAEVEALDAGSGRLGPLLAHLSQGLEDTVRWLETADASALAVVQAASDLAAALPEDDRSPNVQTVVDLADAYPGDPGVVVSLLMHRVTLRTGEAMYLPAGNVHAYLDGLGIELMAPSDNVLRGGLTAKHVDVPELLRVLDFTAYPHRS